VNAGNDGGRGQHGPAAVRTTLYHNYSKRLLLLKQIK